jgi:hypothetical protein
MKRPFRKCTPIHLVGLLAVIGIIAMNFLFPVVPSPIDSKPSDSVHTNPQELSSSPPVYLGSAVQAHSSSLAPVDEPATTSAPIQLPYQYPVHGALPPLSDLREGIQRQFATKASCGGGEASERFSLFPNPPPHSYNRSSQELARQTKLRNVIGRNFDFPYVHSKEGILWPPLDESHREEEPFVPWWIGKTADNLPCTVEAQIGIFRHQHPRRSDQRYISSRLKADAHGVGSAITLVVHDLLSGMILDRVLVVERTPWYFAPEWCDQLEVGRSWECLFAPPTNTLPPRGSATVVKSMREAQQRSLKMIRKGSFDISGIGRNDLPSLERFFGVQNLTELSCMPRLRSWLRDPSNRYLMGTFAKGTDPLLTYMMAQVTRYLLRSPQPWFREGLLHHLQLIGFSGTHFSETSVVAYVQERGEIAKYREYYNTFGCHTIDSSLLSSVAVELCRLEKKSGCSMYVSGNTPLAVLPLLKEKYKAALPQAAFRSTWLHPHLLNSTEAALAQYQNRQPIKAATGESTRWGATSPVASWVDLYAGIGSTAWVCAVQSNWCRIINFMRLTAGRASCPFIDIGMLMIASPRHRQFCVVNRTWPTKPFGNAKPGPFVLN